MRYVGAEGPLGAQLMIVGEAPGEQESLWGRPFVGPSGSFLWNTEPAWPRGVLAELGVAREACYVTNVLKHRPSEDSDDLGHVLTEKKGKAKTHGLALLRGGMWYGERVADALSTLEEEVLAVRPQVIVALGGTALWALTGLTGIAKWRGSELVHELTGTPIIPTYHPTYVLRVWKERVIVAHDLRKRVLGKVACPEQRAEPAWRFRILSSAKDATIVLEELRARLDQGGLVLSVDIETKFNRIACVGVAWSPTDALCLPVMHVSGARVWPAEQERDLLTLLHRCLTHPNARLLGQNFNYDRQYFRADPTFEWPLPCHFDTAIAQHTLFPGTPKDLAYLHSLYGAWYRYWKDEGKEILDEVDEAQWWFYNMRDAAAAWEVGREQMTRFGLALVDATPSQPGHVTKLLEVFDKTEWVRG